jgi:hypothetical protein
MRRLTFLILVTCLAAPAYALTPYTAVYEGTISGLSAETLTTLSADQNGHMEYRSVAKARGFARLIKHDPIVEYTQFEEVDGRLQSIEWHYLFNSSGSKRNSWIIFDHENGVAKSLYKSETVELEIRPEYTDRALEPLVFRTDLIANRVADTYPYLDRNALLEAAYEELGRETLDTKAGSFETVKYRRRRIGSSRSVIIWFAPELEYLPVQLRHFKGDKATGTVTLKRYAFGSVTPR